AEGNPLYAEELAGTGELGPPASIGAVVLAKAAGLPAKARSVADQVCVADGSLSHELLAAALVMREDSLITAARLAVNSGLLLATGDGYAFRHALIQQVLYADLLPGERRRLHRRLAEAMADQDGDPASLAQHWHLAGCRDRAAVAARAYPEADRCYVLALELARWLAEPKGDVLAEAARAASWAGHPDRAAIWIADALAAQDENDSVAITGRQVTSRRRRKRQLAPSPCSTTRRRPRSRRGCSPRSRPGGCWQATSRRRRLLSGRSRWRGRSAPSRKRRTAWRRWGSSRQGTATWPPGSPRLTPHSRWRTRQETSRTWCERRPTGC